ncbi:DNA cytosine methyltransferase [Ruegeria meonggei]|uniref:Cytosine-specific methyltransferase n=1 Tax=Ruegeria meonggei TaxID=1446476 RepID=A0A1X6ZLZ5_9RHOB|nr:DNA (cytosine-5-)-methyltransferase [Ruegeria meonggei]SLN55449.1 Modification methylase AplI [Ruegeria meonggei]
MRAIDLYAGVGGWAVGLKMADVELVCSYEWWQPAADTHRANGNSIVKVSDIRKLKVSDLPGGIDLVVGSPPCTQFSYSNRGGSGNISDGLKDIKCFLDAVRHLKPAHWAFENVPRVKKVLENELSKGTALDEYRDLLEDANIEVFDMAEFGIPQRRKRCIVGTFDFELLRSYGKRLAVRTLGDVVKDLAQGKDPCFQNPSAFSISDNEKEAALSWEEERFNRDMKVAHPVYNGMPFPDPLDRTSRTVTATCTRVSRESLVILDAGTQAYRRLSVRERASLQSFPVTFQFLGKSHAEKLKMVGNAIPPIFTYLIAEAVKGTACSKLKLPAEIDANALLSKATPTRTTPDTAGRVYPSGRRFRFAIPNLRFKSGTRFELANIDGPDKWGVGFYFGDSKRIERRNFETEALLETASLVSEDVVSFVKDLRMQTTSELEGFELSTLQSTWVRNSDGTHPFVLIDALGDLAGKAISDETCTSLAINEVQTLVYRALYGSEDEVALAKNKITSLVKPLVVGMTIAAAVNEMLREVSSQRIAAE